MQNRKRLYFGALFVALLFFLGCASTKLLPHSTQSTEIKWRSYDEVKKIYNTIKEGTTEEELKKRGIHPKIMPITIINDRDIRNKYLPNESVKMEYLDEGVQKCIEAKGQCFGYDFTLERTKSKRVGSFWLDTFGIKREEITSGWKFRGLILLVASKDKVARVVYVERPGGNPMTKKREKKTKPLGPLQTAGEGAVKVGIKSAF